MSQVAILYFSGFGNTHHLASAVEQGVNDGGAKAKLHRIEGKDIVEGQFKNEAVFAELAKADGILFGSPTYMGGPAAQFKAVADASGGVWMSQGWKNKLAGGFTHSGSLSGDKLSTLQYFAVLAAQHGMTWINPAELSDPKTGINRLGSFSGVMGQTAPTFGQKPPELDEGDRQTGILFGKRFAQLVAKYAK